MKTRLFLFSFLLMLLSPASFAAQCNNQQQVSALDNNFELAIKNANSNFLQQVLADNFIWVHNLKSMTETKTSLLKRLAADNYETPVQRTSVIEHFIQGQDTWSVMGISHVYKLRPTEADENNIRHYQYYFSRSYQQIDGKCKLLSSMTMKIHTEDGARVLP
ncbi:nuclear transport factor 2 family protein [Catenovulum agarivorans]|uniref:nuclear transport factor 2 family protein n=1 Tax=Catenovulum agarivorans TaxID=1172192 RepID=UPI00145D8AAA|nr:nuclear transport factor 2 family protein [Catenovulum agarivorans]